MKSAVHTQVMEILANLPSLKVLNIAHGLFQIVGYEEISNFLTLGVREIVVSKMVSVLPPPPFPENLILSAVTTESCLLPAYSA